MKKSLSFILLIFVSLQAMQDPNPGANPKPSDNTLDFGRLHDKAGKIMLKLARFATNLQPQSLRYINSKFNLDIQPIRSFYDPLFDTDEYDYSADLFFDTLGFGNFDLTSFGKVSPRLASVLIHMVNGIKKLAAYDDSREANPDKAKITDMPLPDKNDVMVARELIKELESAPLRPLIDYLNTYQNHEFFSSYPIYTFINNYINSAYKVEGREPSSKLSPRETTFQMRGNKFIFPPLPQMEQ